MATITHSTQPRIFYGWYIVVAATVASFLNSTVFVLGPGVFILDIREHMGWSLSAISLGFSLRQLENGLMAPFAGYLIDRFGPRLMASIGITIMSIGLLLFSVMNSLWMFYISVTTIALGQGMGSTLAYSTSVMHWFVKKRGQAYSITTTGRASAYIGLLGVTWLLVSFGWRGATAIMAISYFVINISLAQLLRPRPQPYGYQPDGERSPVADPADAETPTGKEKVVEEEGFGVKEAMRSLAFWMVLVTGATYGFTGSIHQLNQIPALRSGGLSATTAATVVAIFGGIQVVGRLVAGWTGDKIGRTGLYMMSFLFLSIGWLIFANIAQGKLWLLVPYLAVFGMGLSAYTSISETVVADFFGVRRYATIRGTMNSLALGCTILGPVFAGFMFDRFGNYYLAFVALSPIIALGAPAIFIARRTLPKTAPAPASAA